MTAPVNRPMTAALSMRVSILMAMVAIGSGCTNKPPATLSTVKPSPTPQLVDMGRQLYTKQCAVCHGVTGSGNGPAAYLLYPKPRDFTQGEFRLVSTDTMQATDEDLFLTVTRGMPGAAMPPWELLNPEQRWALVYYIRYLEEVGEQQRAGALTEAEVVQGLPWSKVERLVLAHATEASMSIPPEPPSFPDALTRGRAIYTQACASCHGPQGRGDGQQAMIPPPTASAEGGTAPEAQALQAAVGGGMTDNAGFPIKPRDFTAGVFKGSSESKDLYYRIVAGLPGSPMPSYAGVYTDEQLWDLIHYVQSLIPPGVEERVRLRHQTVQARRVRGGIPSDPSADIWNSVQPVAVAVTPLWWRDQRIEGLDINALHNGKELAFHLSWDDPTRDDSLVSQQAFSDGVAVQLSAESDPPFFGMGGLPAAPGTAQAGDHGAVAPPPVSFANGEARPRGPRATYGGEPGGGVAIWHWKAAWQQDLAAWQDIETAYPDAAVDWYPGQRDYRHGDAFEARDAKTASQEPSLMAGWGAGNPLSIPTRTSAAEEATAKGLGTLTSRPLPIQRVRATGEWREGRWRVVLHRPLARGEKGDLVLRPGQKVSVAFAVWDGQAEDRDGQKSVSIWQTLRLER